MRPYLLKRRAAWLLAALLVFRAAAALAQPEVHFSRTGGFAIGFLRGRGPAEVGKRALGRLRSGISEKTVKVHRARVMRMRARSVAELVRLADRADVIVPKA